MVELYFQSPIRLHGVIIKHMDNFAFFSFYFSTVKMDTVRFFDMWRTILPDYRGPPVFARLDAVIVGSNPALGMDVWCVYVYSVCVVPCVGRGLVMG
jgi:hypothetical protein